MGMMIAIGLFLAAAALQFLAPFFAPKQLISAAPVDDDDDDYEPIGLLVNPTTGLPMTSMGGLDVSGTPFGCVDTNTFHSSDD